MKRIGIFGTSGHAREVADVAWALGWEPVYIARGPAEVQAWTYPGEVMTEEGIARYSDMEYTIGIGDNAVRAAVAKRFAGRVRFANLVHPDTSFGHGQRQALAGRSGILICAGVRLANHIRVGDFTIFNRNATVGHDCVLEDYAHLAPCACISGNVHLGEGCWIGAGAVLNQGLPEAPLAIGAGCIVGSGAVVTRNCEAGAVYAGVPAKRIR